MKNKGLIIGGTVVVALSLFAWHVYSKANDFIDQLKVKVKGFSIPSIQSGIATVPLKLELINPVDLAVAVKSLNVIISVKQADGSYKQVGNVSTGAIQIPAAANKVIDLSPQLNLNNLNPFQGQSISDIFGNIFGSKPLLTFLIEYSGVYDDPVTGNIPFQGSEEMPVTLPKTINFNV